MNMNEQTTNCKDEVKTVGGAIPSELYWQFKQTQAGRKETATQALENAIRLYIEIDAMEGTDG